MRIHGLWGKPLFSILLLSVTSIQAKRTLDKPSLFKNGLGDLKEGLMRYLPVPEYRIYKWRPGLTIPDCIQEAKKANITSLEKLETFYVFYDDCDHPWTICRHTETTDPLKSVIENFGRVPVR